MRKFVSLLLALSLIYTSPSYAAEYEDLDPEYEDFNPIEYSYQEPGDGYVPYSGTDFGPYYRQAPYYEDTCQTSGVCYFNSKRASCLTVGVAIGAAMIIAMVAIVFQDGNSAHDCHHDCHH